MRHDIMRLFIIIIIILITLAHWFPIQKQICPFPLKDPHRVARMKPNETERKGTKPHKTGQNRVDISGLLLGLDTRIYGPYLVFTARIYG